MKGRMQLKTHTYQNSFSALVCSLVACWFLGLAPIRAGDLNQLKPPGEQTRAAGYSTNTFEEHFVDTNRLKLRLEPSGKTSWAAGYVTDIVVDEKAWTNRVSLAAESGDTQAQVSLAMCLHDGMHGFATNRVQAYKWAAVAASQGYYKAKRLVEEWQASMSPEDVAAGKAAAGAFTPRDKKKQD
jgi:hypothetical protein